MATEHAFAELGLACDATGREVKAAWRRLVSQWHPDRNASADAVAKMQRINRAFEEIRRAGLLRTDDGGAEKNEAPAQEPASTPRRRPIHRKLKLTIEEAALGCIKVLRGKVTDVCATCAGAGHLVLGGHCVKCGGSGALARRSFFGWPGGLTECEACLGGGIARQACPACLGAGKAAPRGYTVKVRIPSGVRHGDLLHVGGGEGAKARSDRPPADLEIRVEIAPHDFFELDDDGTLRCEVPVDGFAWIANRSIQVPTLSGLQPLQLQRDRMSYRLEGQGFPIERRGARGDQSITVRPIFPDNLSTDQEILLDQLLATGAQGTDGRLREWKQRVKAWERGL